MTAILRVHNNASLLLCVNAEVFLAILLFALAGLAEIGGGWLA